MAPMSENLSTNSTEHGWLQPGWSQEESASPHVLGDQTGETRQTVFSAVAKADSDLMIGKPLTATGPFSSTGVSLETTLTGDMVSTASYDVDSKFLPIRKFPGIASGWEEAALDAFQREYGEGGVTLPWTSTGVVHAYYPLRGFQQGYTVDGFNKPYYQTSWGSSVTQSGGSNSYYWGKHAAPVNAYVRFPAGVYAAAGRVLHSGHGDGTVVNYQAMRVQLVPGGAISSRINLQWAGTAVVTDIDVVITATTGTAGTIGITGQYRQEGAGSATAITPATVPCTGIDMTKEVGLVFQWGWLTSGAGATLRVKIYAYDPLSPPAGAPTVVQTTDLPNAMRSTFSSNNSTISRTAGVAGSCGYRDVVLSQTNSSWPVHYPVVSEPDLIECDFTKNNLSATSSTDLSVRAGAIQAWEGSGWDYLKMMATGRGLQFGVASTGKLLVTDLFPIATPQPVMNAIGQPTLKIQAAGRARSIDVTAHRTKASRSFTPAGVPQASAQFENLSISLDVKQEVQTQLNLPQGEHQVGSVFFDVEDSLGRVAQWSVLTAAGARCRSSVDLDGRLALTFRGPDDDDLLFTTGATGTAPWRITRIRVYNMGYLNSDELITIYTGAPEEMVTREKGGTIDNPFLCTTADVFDRSTWLISSEGSPRVTLDWTVPTADLDRYVVGTVVTYGWGHFRVMKVTSGRGVSEISCDWFATQAQQSNNWVGMTANQWNTYWTGRRAYDVFLRPLASSVPVTDPRPFVRVYPSEPSEPVVPVIPLYGDGIYGTGFYGY